VGDPQLLVISLTGLLAWTAVENCITGLYFLYADDPMEQLRGENALASDGFAAIWSTVASSPKRCSTSHETRLAALATSRRYPRWPKW
jgi:hypothetical protein